MNTTPSGGAPFSEKLAEIFGEHLYGEERDNHVEKNNESSNEKSNETSDKETVEDNTGNSPTPKNQVDDKKGKWKKEGSDTFQYPANKVDTAVEHDDIWVEPGDSAITIREYYTNGSEMKTVSKTYIQ